MEIKKRNYQLLMKRLALEKIRNNENFLLYGPTGSGKTIVAALITDTLIKKNKTVLVSVYRDNILDQFVESFKSVLGDSFYKDVFVVQGGGSGPIEHYPIVIGMVKTIKRCKNITPDIIIADEGHRAEHLALFENWPSAIKAGLSATPVSSSDIPLSETYGKDSLILCVSHKELINQGFLSRPLQYDYNLGDIKLKNGSYLNKNQFLKFKKNKKLVIDRWEEKNPTKEKTIFFCNDVITCNEYLAYFRSRFPDIPSYEVHSNMSKDEIKQNLKKSKEEANSVLFNVQIASVGYDDINIRCVVLLIYTNSIIMYHQMGGRCARPKLDGVNQGCILDFGNNFNRFSPIGDYFDWSSVYTKTVKTMMESPTFYFRCECYPPRFYHRKESCDTCGVSKESSEEDFDINKIPYKDRWKYKNKVLSKYMAEKHISEMNLNELKELCDKLKLGNTVLTGLIKQNKIKITRD